MSRIFIRLISMGVIAVLLLLTQSPAQAQNNASLVAFNKLTPPNGAVLPMPETTYKFLTWSDAGADITDRYQYCIDEINNAQCDNQWVTRNSLYSGGPGDFVLQRGRTYYWQVRLRDDGLYADKGVWWSFKIDPNNTQTQVFESVAAEDGFINEASETSGTGGVMNKNNTIVKIGDDAANRQFRAILSFNTSPLPDDAIITAVTLKFKYAGKAGTNPFNTHGKLLADVRKGAFRNNPALQVTDFNAGATKNAALAYTNTLVDLWYIKSFTTDQFQYINLIDVTQFRLRFKLDDNNDLGADLIKVYSGNAEVGNRPQLIVEYSTP